MRTRVGEDRIFRSRGMSTSRRVRVGNLITVTSPKMSVRVVARGRQMRAPLPRPPRPCHELPGKDGSGGVDNPPKYPRQYSLRCIRPNPSPSPPRDAHTDPWSGLPNARADARSWVSSTPARAPRMASRSAFTAPSAWAFDREARSATWSAISDFLISGSFLN